MSKLEPHSVQIHCTIPNVNPNWPSLLLVFMCLVGVCRRCFADVDLRLSYKNWKC